jgi:hypothetical protein
MVKKRRTKMGESTINTVITRTSQYGFQVEDFNDEWINYGKFYNGKKEYDVGENIKLEFMESKGKKYVKDINDQMANLDDVNLGTGASNRKETHVFESHKTRNNDINWQSARRDALDFLKHNNPKAKVELEEWEALTQHLWQSNDYK